MDIEVITLDSQPDSKSDYPASQGFATDVLHEVPIDMDEQKEVAEAEENGAPDSSSDSSQEPTTEQDMETVEKYLGNKMPDNYCNSDLGQFFTGLNSCPPKLDRTLSAKPKAQTDFDDFMFVCQQQALKNRAALRLANTLELGDQIPEEMASDYYPHDEALRKRFTSDLYQYLAAENPEQAIYLKTRHVCRLMCWSCMGLYFRGYGHLHYCCASDRMAFDRNLRYALGELRFSADDETFDSIKEILNLKYTRTSGDLVDLAKRRAKTPVDQALFDSDLVDDPLRKEVGMLTYIERCRDIAKKDPKRAVEKWIRYAAQKRCEACKLGRYSQLEHRRAERGCMRPWHSLIEDGFEDACITLHLDYTDALEKTVLALCE